MLQAKNLNNQIQEIWPENGPPSEEVQKYIKKYLKEKIVIKCGGKVLLDPNPVSYTHLTLPTILRV